MVKASLQHTPVPPLPGAQPANGEELCRLQRLSLRIFGLMTWDLSQNAREMVQAAGLSLRRKDGRNLHKALSEELPVLLLIHAAEKLTSDDRLLEQELVDLTYGLLLPCFSLCYQNLYEKPADPLKHLLARLDWYLDGDKDNAQGAFMQVLETIMGGAMEHSKALLEHLNRTLLPLMDQRYELAFRYEFA